MDLDVGPSCKHPTEVRYYITTTGREFVYMLDLLSVQPWQSPHLAYLRGQSWRRIATSQGSKAVWKFSPLHPRVLYYVPALDS